MLAPLQSLRDPGMKSLWFPTAIALALTACQAKQSEPSTDNAVQAEQAATAGAGANTDTTHWQCAETRLSLRFDAAAKQAELSLPGSALTLPQAPSASGARYADHRGNEFWSKGSQATLTLQGQPPVECTQADLPSPWAQAEARGLAFRGIGTEPGWLIEVGSGAAPALHAELDYGERIVDVANAEAFAGGYRGSTGDGVAVELRIRRETCSDGMSDQSYPAAIALTVGERSYRGCGRYLGQ